MISPHYECHVEIVSPSYAHPFMHATNPLNRIFYLTLLMFNTRRLKYYQFPPSSPPKHHITTLYTKHQIPKFEYHNKRKYIS